VADVCVLGAGIAGVSAALEAAKLGRTAEGSLNRRVSTASTITFQYDEVRLGRWIERSVDRLHASCSRLIRQG
jgi:monoamine oxidase